MMQAVRRRLLLLAALGGVAILLLVRSPHEPGHYPLCPFHFLTGLHCPGCGSLRGLHALLHGEVRQALAYNALAILMLPLILGWLLWGVVADLRGRPIRPRPLPAWVYWLGLVILLAYWVLRNVPAPPFDQLAPHRIEETF